MLTNVWSVFPRAKKLWFLSRSAPFHCQLRQTGDKLSIQTTNQTAYHLSLHKLAQLCIKAAHRWYIINFSAVSVKNSEMFIWSGEKGSSRRADAQFAFCYKWILCHINDIKSRVVVVSVLWIKVNAFTLSEVIWSQEVILLFLETHPCMNTSATGWTIHQFLRSPQVVWGNTFFFQRTNWYILSCLHLIKRFLECNINQSVQVTLANSRIWERGSH